LVFGGEIRTKLAVPSDAVTLMELPTTRAALVVVRKCSLQSLVGDRWTVRSDPTGLLVRRSVTEVTATATTTPPW
jgi:hypothetical protein